MEIRHSGLKALYENDDARHLPTDLVKRIQEVLTTLEKSYRPENMDMPGYRSLPLRGSKRSIAVSQDYQITFEFQGRKVKNVDFVYDH